MFVFSKLFWIVAQPLSLSFFLILIGLAAGKFGLRRIQTATVTTAALVMFVSLYTTAGSAAMAVLENRFQRPQTMATAPQCAIILGGGLDAEITTSRGNIETNAAGDRFLEGYRLLRTWPGMMLVISGGDGTLEGGMEGEGAIARRYYAELGLDQKQILSEDKSRNTIDNAANSKILLEKAGLKQCLLVTSAFHMPRAMGLFRKQGVDVIAWPTDYYTTGKTSVRFEFTQPFGNAEITTTALHEWIGLLAAYLGGKTHQLFPEAL
jgi:uncharacterized SAM-binding protein YcdF (DUF218 family)